MITPLIALSFDSLTNRREFEKKALTRSRIFLLNTILMAFPRVRVKASATLNHVAIFHAAKTTQATVPIAKNKANSAITFDRQVTAYGPVKWYQTFSLQRTYKS